MNFQDDYPFHFTNSPTIISLGVELPVYSLSLGQAIAHAQPRNCADSPQRARVLERLYRRTEINSRSTVLHLNEADPAKQFYPVDDAPTTSQRMQRYAQEVVPLALAASRAAIGQAGIQPCALKQLVTASCTGFFAPGLDLALIEHLELSREIGRTHIGFMGCHGALNALRAASALCVSSNSHVLVCAAEICSLHFQYGWEADDLLANALFADGAAALILAPPSSLDSKHNQMSSAPQAVSEATLSSSKLTAADKATAIRVLDSKSYVIPNTSDLMTWTIGDFGFSMTLSARVSDVILSELQTWINNWLSTFELSADKVELWAIHPGGPRILDAVQSALSLSEEVMLPSRTVFEECGNMSSPTVLFILQRLLQTKRTGPCVMLAFGPGLTIEAALLYIGN